jgi:hypothetical protein
MTFGKYEARSPVATDTPPRYMYMYIYTYIYIYIHTHTHTHTIAAAPASGVERLAASRQRRSALWEGKINEKRKQRVIAVAAAAAASGVERLAASRARRWRALREAP